MNLWPDKDHRPQHMFRYQDGLRHPGI